MLSSSKVSFWEGHTVATFSIDDESLLNLCIILGFLLKKLDRI